MSEAVKEVAGFLYRGITFIALWFAVGVTMDYVIQPEHTNWYMSAGFLFAYVSRALGLIK